ncbi:MAG: 6-phosphofructokinase [Eubacterium sp.]
MAQNMLIGQSGGPTAVINSSLAGAMQYAFSRDEIDTVYGMINGITGLLNDNLINLNDVFKAHPSKINRLKLTPAMYLGSCRYKLSADGDEFEGIVKQLEKYDIKYFVYIGGNDSMDTVQKLYEYTKKHHIDVKVAGIPKTVDNDLCGIDHSPGFGSAAKYVATAVRNVSYDTSIYSVKSVHIIETMGRNAGWLTAASALARDKYEIAPHLIYLPEIPFSVDGFIDDLQEKLRQYNSVIAVVSEGIRDEGGEYYSTRGEEKDLFGHAPLSGCSAYLRDIVTQRIGCKVRALELSVLQRSGGHATSLTDVEEAFNLGVTAVKAVLQGETGVFSTLKRTSNLPYTVEYGTDNVSVIANAEKLVPREWINERGNDVTEEMIEYLTPLIEGVPQTPYRNGLPDYIDIAHLDINKQNYSDQ